LFVLKQVTFKRDKKSLFTNIDGLCKHFDKICLFDSNSNANQEQEIEYDQLLALGSVKELSFSSDKINFQELEKFLVDNNDWKFGYLSYDIKNSIENLSSEKNDGLKFSLAEFFIPKFVFEIKNNKVVLYYDQTVLTLEEAKNAYKIAFSEDYKKDYEKQKLAEIKNRISKQQYLNSVNNLKQHIQKGNIYEINFCHEFYIEDAEINPAKTFLKLNEISQAPFASFCKFNNNYVISSSPERFIKKTGNRLISQPIKGTAKRSVNKKEDELLKIRLQNDKKEQNENVMIVDLVRNDLSKIAKKGSVKVDELFGVYSFKQVHQMISTISCEIKDGITFSEIIKSLFPMGSMTGAPKISAMQLIEEYEKTKRGLYSGSIGYIKPNGDFDFNVIIRTILYNSENKYLSFMVGSAITAQSDAETEYEECLLKAKAMIEILNN